jgi:DNA polymerase-1
MTRLLADLETDGLLPEVTVIHCGVVYDLDTHEIREYGPDQIPELIEHLRTAHVVAGHNWCGYDLLVLEKLHGYSAPGQLYLDTLAMSRYIFPGSARTTPLVGLDIAFQRKYGETEGLESKHHGRHTLKAWSIRLRLGDQGKLDYTGGWEKWSQELQDYCRNDVIANVALLNYFLQKDWPLDLYYVESHLNYYLAKQEQCGVAFDEQAAVELMSTLIQKRAELDLELGNIFPPIEVKNGPPKVAKADRVCRKYEEGHPKWFPPRKKGEKYQLYKTEHFNPASTAHIARRLITLYGWEPQAFTPGGTPQVTDEILRDLPWPEAQKCAEYQVIKRILGYLNEGKQAWLSLVQADGRIHGGCMPTGATTTRAGHSRPNLAQVPKAGKPYGAECRALFRAGKGKVLVGADASSLQLAIYSHYVAKYDGGTLAELCQDGDPHEYMRRASGLFYRDSQKTLTYATWFGAGQHKQGMIVLNDWARAFEEGLHEGPVPAVNDAVRLGAAINRRMHENMAGYADLARDCAKAAERGYVMLLDGRKLDVKQARMVLVTLLQGNEAVIMKRAYLMAMQALAWQVANKEAHPVLWIHDEMQWECDPDIADLVGKTLTQCITEAGEHVGLRLKLGGDYKVGETWAQTH